MTGEPGKKHILLCGERGAGKSTLIQRLLEKSSLPVYGFYTKRLAADETGFHPIYIHDARAGERACAEQNRIGSCNAKVHSVSLSAFNTLGVEYLDAPQNALIVMDELGFMEAGAEAFVNQVFRVLDGGVPVLAAVKARTDVPFLNAVRAHENCRVYTVTPENRDALYEALFSIVTGWNK